MKGHRLGDLVQMVEVVDDPGGEELADGDAAEVRVGTLAVEHDRIIAARSYSIIRAAQEVPRWLAMNPRPDGIFAATDEMAMGVVIAASSHGLTPGRDYQIVGFDGQQRGRDLPDHPLTTVDVPVQEMGRRAAELLCSRLATPDRAVRRLFLGCTLFDGATAVPSA